MILSVSFLNINKGVLVVLSLFFYTGCANLSSQALVAEPALIKNVRLAVYPTNNLSGTKVPLKETRQLFIERLQTQGVDILSDEALEKFMTRHRIRYTGGLSVKESELFKNELETDAVLIISYEFYDDSPPPKIALAARLVSAGNRPAILWADSVGLAGDDSPGLFGLGLIGDPQKLLGKAVQYLSGSLINYLSRGVTHMRGPEQGSGGESGQGQSTQAPSVVPAWNVKELFGSFRPRSYYITPFADARKRYSVVVMPFMNKSYRRNAGDIVMLEFIKQLSTVKNFTVLDPGMLRQKMLDERIMMLDSLSLADFDLITGGLNADLVLTGFVTDYIDYNGPFGTCQVGFSVLLLDRKQRKTVFTSISYNTGDDRIIAFDLGRMRTAHALASEMIRVTVGRLTAGMNTGT